MKIGLQCDVSPRDSIEIDTERDDFVNIQSWANNNNDWVEIQFNDVEKVEMLRDCLIDWLERR